MPSRTRFPAHFMVIVSIFLLEFLDSLMVFWLVITELGRALNWMGISRRKRPGK